MNKTAGRILKITAAELPDQSTGLLADTGVGICSICLDITSAQTYNLTQTQ